MATLTADTDIVFLVDVSGSMSGYITKVKNVISDFADSLSEENVTFRLGLVEFESTATTYEFTDDVEEFKSNLTKLSTYGGTEYGLTAIQSALGMDFREGVTKRFIMLTDEGYEENDYASYSDTYTQSNTVLTLMIDNGVVLDVVGRMDGYGSGSYSTYYCQGDYEPIANATGGNFYDIDSLDYTTFFEEIASEILNQNDTVVVNLNNVGESETGVFVISSYVTSDSATATSTVATFKTAAESSDTIVGKVTEDKVYVAETDSEYRQNITIPENWNVTGTSNNDALHITGDGVTAKGGEGNDRFYVASGVKDVNFVDFTPSEDSLSFGTQIPEDSLIKAMFNEALSLSNGDINLMFQNMTSVTNELSNKQVNNGGVTNTIGELIEGANIINPDSPVVMSLSRWSYGFNPESK